MKLLKKVIKLCFCVSLVWLFSCSSPDGQEGYTTISKLEALELIKDTSVIIVDVRTPYEVSSGKIKDAVVLNYFSPDFKTRLMKLDKDKKVLIYCKSGTRSSKACSDAYDQGFTSVYNLKGGYLDWINE